MYHADNERSAYEEIGNAIKRDSVSVVDGNVVIACESVDHAYALLGKLAACAYECERRRYFLGRERTEGM